MVYTVIIILILLLTAHHLPRTKDLEIENGTYDLQKGGKIPKITSHRCNLPVRLHTRLGKERFFMPLSRVLIKVIDKVAS